MFDPNKHKVREITVKRYAPIILIFAVIAVWYWLTNDSLTEPEASVPTVSEELVRLCGGDQALAERLDKFRASAIEIGNQRGTTGLQVLDTFGDDAVYLYRKKPESFGHLQQLFELDQPLFELSTGPWKQPVIDWAMAGTLPVYLAQLPKLTAEDLAILQEIPDALPLLISDTPIANRMLSRYGFRAWELLMQIDLSSEHSIERAADAIEEFGEKMLDLNADYGPCISFLLIRPEHDDNGLMPATFLSAIEHMGADAATPLFLTNYDDLQRLILDERVSAGEIEDAFRFLGSAQAVELKEWAGDSPYTIRLLLTELDGVAIGRSVYERCGPEAATLLYGPGGYGAVSVAVDPSFSRQLANERRAALYLLRDHGWKAGEFLTIYQALSPLRDLLRREDLLNSPSDPLSSKVVSKLFTAGSVESETDLLLRKPADQLLQEQYPDSAMDQAGAWIPGYTALKVAGKLASGYHVTGLEATFAIVDGVTAVTGVAAIAKQAVKTTGKKVVSEALKKTGAEIAEQSTSQAARTLATRVPGAAYKAIEALRSAGKIDVSAIARATTETAKKVGIRSWGKLDRRIIMRRDRQVIVDFTSEQFRKEVARRAAEETTANTVSEIAPYLLERTITGLGAFN